MQYVLIICAILTGTLSVRVPVSWSEENIRTVPPDSLWRPPIRSNARSIDTGVSYNNDWIPIKPTTRPAPTFFWDSSKLPAESRQALRTPAQAHSPLGNTQSPQIQSFSINELKPAVPSYSRPIVLSTNIQPKQNSISSEGGYSRTRFFPEITDINKNRVGRKETEDASNVLENSETFKKNYLKKLEEHPQKIHQAIIHSYNNPSSVAPVIATKDQSTYIDPRLKNYRDDSLHEPLPYDAEKAKSDKEDEEALKEDEEDDEEENAKEEFKEEVDQNLPTRPIYPGEGVWAKRGQNYKQYVPKKPIEEGVQTENLAEERKEIESDARPAGHHIFEDLENFFVHQKDMFDHQFHSSPTDQRQGQATNTPANVARFSPLQAAEEQRTIPSIVYDPFGDSRPAVAPRMVVQSPQPPRTIGQHPKVQQPRQETSGESGEVEEEESEEEEFVPVKLYTQVRKTENEEHLPPDPAENGKLKEVIKDSVIRTVYTEEGYEDSGYDHAGHEKKAEKDEGFAEFEKDVENKEEKKHTTEPPKLIIPKDKVYSSKFKSEDYDANRLIKEKLEFNDEDDAEPAASQVHSENNNQIRIESKSKPFNKNNFAKSKESKLMSVRDKENGNGQEMEISSEVRVILQPNNSTKKQKFVKIYPKIIKDLEKNKKGDYVTTEKSLSKGTTKKTETIFTEQVSATIQATTEMPKVRVKLLTTTEKSKVRVRVLDPENEPIVKISESFISLNSRKKRFTDDIEIDTDFIDKINHTLPPKQIINTEKKYPYYKSTILPENSPLRYGENLENAPLKQEGKMSFYTQAESQPCPEIPANVDPVPDRIKNAKEEEDDEQDESEDGVPDSRTPKTPRLRDLGDKIDCLKVRYFGENPLDSPFFNEKYVSAPKPIFIDLSKQKITKAHQIGAVTPLLKQSTNIAENIIKTENVAKKMESIPSVPAIVQTIKTTTSEKTPVLLTRQPITSTTIIATTTPSVGTSSIVTLITTPKYTIDFKPKNIYDQIKLLRYLPDNGTFQEQNVMENVQRVDIAEKITYPEKYRESKRLKEEETLPDQQALKQRRRHRRPTQKPSMTTNYGIFDITKYWPSHHHMSESSTVLPKNKVVSEVFYKDEIKPNEQLNVFADVLNNIKNSTAQEQEQSHEISVKLNTLPPTTPQMKNRVKKYQEDSSKYVNSVDIRKKPISTTLQYDYTYPSEQEETTPLEIEDKQRDSEKYIEKHHKLSHKKIEAESEEKLTDKKHKWGKQAGKEESGTTRFVIDYIEEPRPILGLMPPPQINQKYHTIILPPIHILPPVTVTEPFRPSPAIYSIAETSQTQPQESSSAPPTYDVSEKIENLQMNKFFYVGMKPPPKQKILLYSDFLNNNLVGERRNGFVKRHKRDTNRRSYAEVSRRRGASKGNGGKIDVMDSSTEDDYVPNRTRNWHYDENTGKIVYNKKTDPVEDQEEEVEYIEVEDSPATYKPEKVKEAETTKPLLATATPPPEGQGFVDFVAKLKNNPSYIFIPDPTTTEKGKQSITTEKIADAASTIKADSTKPPEFLSILSKVRQDNTYKLIEDPDDKKKKKITTTTEAIEMEDDDDDDEEMTAVEESKDSQSRQTLDASKLQIFDIGEFLPKIKNYMPKTSIDYSKYKSIERPTVKPDPKDRYDDEEETIKEASKQEDVKEEQTPTTTTRPTTTTTSKQRTRGRTRLTTLKSNPRNQQAATSAPLSSDTHAPSKRTYRRRPQRIRSKPSTEQFIEEEVEETTKAKTVRRRSETGSRVLGENFLPNTNLEKSTIILSNTGIDKIQLTDESNINATIAVINPETNTDFKKLKNVEVMKIIDMKRRHGGNYKNEDEVIEKDVKIPILPKSNPQEVQSVAKISEIQPESRKRRVRLDNRIKKLPDIIVQDSLRVARVVTLANGAQEKNSLSDKNIKDVEVIQKYNKKKKHGGNYKGEPDFVDTENNNDDYDKIIQEHTEELKDGQIIKNNNDVVDDSIRVARIAVVGNNGQNLLRKKIDVETLKKYDPKKKHGGNYKHEDEIMEKKVLSEITSLELDENKGSSEGEQSENLRLTRVASIDGIDQNKNILKNVEIIKKFDASKKHGGNYKSEDEVIQKEISNSKIKIPLGVEDGKDAGHVNMKIEERKFNQPSKRINVNKKTVQRLVDAVRKPEDFYTDPALPKQVNQMVERNRNIQVEELIIEEENENNGDEESDELNAEEGKVNFSVERTKLFTTKKPLIIKDPSKRLYFYAPV